MLVRTLPLLLAALLTIHPASAQAQLRATLLATGFDRPNTVVVDPLVPGAVYVVDQTGIVRAFLNGVERPAPFLDLRAIVAGGYDERGLLGLAFPPDAATTGRVFVNFVKKLPPPAAGDTVVARFTRSAADPMVLDPASRFDLLWPGPGPAGVQPFIFQPYQNHNGGHLAFGPDGYLYIGLGDGGSGNDPLNNAQNPATLLGKMLRIDVSGSPANGYTIPPTNPTFPVAGALPEIWAFGLRNPWRYNFDDLGPGATGALVIADVGQGDREEIDYEPAGRGGRNYGWRVYEGTRENFQEAPAYFPLTAPIFEYTRAVGQAITGGYVYRGAALGAAFQGRYFYADCVQGKIWSLQLNVNPVTGDAAAGVNTEHTVEMGGRFNCISAFARDPAGELYFMDFDAGAGPGTARIFKIESATTAVPGVPTNLAASVQGATVSLSWAAPATGGTPTGYVVEAGTSRGAANLGSAPTPGTSLAVGGVPDGQYFVRVRATSPAGTSAPSGDLVVNVGCVGAPAPPSTLTATVVGTAVTLTWTVGAGTTATVIDAGLAAGTTALSTPLAAPTSTVTVSSVPSGTYFVRARAVNACGASGASVERTIVVP